MLKEERLSMILKHIMPFQKGNKLATGRPKGALNEKTSMWNNIGECISTWGAERFLQELNTLTGKDYIFAYTNIVEFFKPKLARNQNDTTVKVISLSSILEEIGEKEASTAYQKENVV